MIRVSKVFMICDAYEAGYGKGQMFSQDENPYSPDSEEFEAWGIGYERASMLELERLENVIS